MSTEFPEAIYESVRARMAQLKDSFPQWGEFSAGWMAVLRRYEACHPVGGTYVGVVALRKAVSDENERVGIALLIDEELQNWDERASAALRDCDEFMERSLPERPPEGEIAGDIKFAFADALGSWVLWNIYGRAPSDEEFKPVRVLGGLLQSAFYDWWSELEDTSAAQENEPP